MSDPKAPRPQLEITVSWATLRRIFVAGLLVLLLIKLWPLLALLFLALLIAITLWPVVRWMVGRGWPKWSGVLISALLLVGFAALVLIILVPTMANQAAELIPKLPKLQEEVVKRLPSAGPTRDAVNKLMESASFSNPEALLDHLVSWGAAALRTIGGFVVMLIVAIYFLADGQRVSNWLLAFLPPNHRHKMASAQPEIAAVVSSYMVGQLITSLLCGVFAFIVLAALHVPSAALLAVLAAVFDILPMIGFFLFTLPAVAMALTVSPATAALVGALFGAYHMVEVYFIVPKVYGDQLRLSTLTVLVACLAAGWVAGVVGAIAILPIVASYPIIERIWLTPYLEPDTVVKHEAIDAEEHPKG